MKMQTQLNNYSNMKTLKLILRIVMAILLYKWLRAYLPTRPSYETSSHFSYSTRRNQPYHDVRSSSTVAKHPYPKSTKTLHQPSVSAIENVTAFYQSTTKPHPSET